MSLTPEALYFELESLVAEMPDLAAGPITADMNSWLGRAAVLVKMTGDTVESVKLVVASENLFGVSRDRNAHTITAVVNRALAKARLDAPAAYQGSFIDAERPYDAFVAVGKVLKKATVDVFMVDPHADDKALDDYALLTPEKVTVRLLVKTNYKLSLKPAAERWVRQWGDARPLAVRVAPGDSLHNRLIMVDHKTAWELGQSFNGLA
jgi:hypothetical protein